MTASRALQVNQRISKTAHIKELNTEIGRLKAELHATREKNGVYIPLEHFHQQEQVCQSSLSNSLHQAGLAAPFI